MTPGLLVVGVLLLCACDWGGQPPGGGPAVGSTATPGPTAGGPPAEEAGGLPCRAGDLRVVAGWQGAGGSMAGGLTLINKGTTSCSLQGRPGIHLIDGQGNLMPVANVKYSEAPSSGTPAGTPASSGGAVTLRPGGKSFVFFVWANWCLPAQGPFKLAVSLPGQGGQLTAPVQDPNGAPVSTTPRCEDAGTASTISVGVFK